MSSLSSRHRLGRNEIIEESFYTDCCFLVNSSIRGTFTRKKARSTVNRFRALRISKVSSFTPLPCVYWLNEFSFRFLLKDVNNVSCHELPSLDVLRCYSSLLGLGHNCERLDEELAFAWLACLLGAGPQEPHHCAFTVR